MSVLLVIWTWIQANPLLVGYVISTLVGLGFKALNDTSRLHGVAKVLGAFGVTATQVAQGLQQIIFGAKTPAVVAATAAPALPPEAAKVDAQMAPELDALKKAAGK